MIIDQILLFLGKVITFGGGSAAVAYLLFQYLGRTWIENKFDERLEQLRHSQALELQRLRVEIDSMLSGAIKIQDKEFEVLPEAWIRLDEAYGHVAQLVSPVQWHNDLDRMRADQLEEVLAAADFRDSEKADIRNAAKKTETYLETRFWHRLNRVRKAVSDFHNYIERNSVFMPPDLKKDFEKVSDELWSAMTSKEVGHEAKDWKMQNEGWDKIKKVAEPLKQSIHDAIYKRLQGHGRK